MPRNFELTWPKVLLSDLRGRLTYMCFLTHEVLVQPLLPQILVGNEHEFTWERLAGLAGWFQEPVYLWRERTAWCTAELLKKAMRLLMKLLAPVLDDYEPVLVMDVYQSHCTREVLQLAWLLGLKLLFVPSLCTWLLQPCDASYFARFKRAVRIAWMTAYAESGGDGISHVAWVRIVVRVQALSAAATGHMHSGPLDCWTNRNSYHPKS